ncbi:hypothetical protein OH807_07015 [Kitasatospora sp. NBC_01560]
MNGTTGNAGAQRIRILGGQHDLTVHAVTFHGTLCTGFTESPASMIH